jgi:hypothetical protein
MELTGRPLTTAEEDQRLYVKRAVDERLTTSLSLGANVLIRARRGAGATSLLNRVESAVDDAISLNAASARSADDLLHAVIARGRVPQDVLGSLLGSLGRPDPLAAPTALGELRAALSEQGRHVTMLVDGPVDPAVSHDLFGRFRDDVFSVPATWIVVAHDERAREYLTPPADVFFEDVTTIDDLDDTHAREVLRRRGVLERLPEENVAAILSAQDGTPRSVVTLARAQLRHDPRHAHAAMRAYADATAGLPRRAAMLLAELQARGGPAAATDGDLLGRLGTTDRQLRRDFDVLEGHGLVERVPSGRPGNGRPPTTFLLTDLGRAEGLNRA